MKRLLLTILFILALIHPESALGTGLSTTIGNANITATGGFAVNNGDVLTLQAQIIGCSGQVPTYGNLPISITPNQTPAAPFTADNTETVTFTLPGNDNIICGGQNYTLYAITWKINGFPAGPTASYRLLDNSNINLNLQVPIGFIPPVINNVSGSTCPAGSYLNGYSPSFVATCISLPSATSNAVVVNPVATQVVQMPTSSHITFGSTPYLDIDWLGNLNATSVNGVVNAAKYASLNAAVSACAIAGGCTVDINTAVTLSANLTVPANTTLRFHQPGKINLSGHTLTTAAIEAARYQIFSSGTVTFSAQVILPPVEWFGAVGDWNGSTGTDNTAAIQACLNAVTNTQCSLLAASYKTTAPLSITRSNIGIVGVANGLPSPTLYPSPAASTIIITSATADILDVSGTNATNTITYNTFTNFTLARNQSPGTSAAGLRLSFSYGAKIDGVTAMDCTAGFIFHGVGSQGTGYIKNSAATWGYNGFAETSGSLAGFQIDSTDGTTSPSLRINDSFVAANTTLSGTTTYGLLSNGAALNDLMTDHLETATVNYGVFLQALSVASPATDIHIINAINDGCITTCIYIQNIVAGSLEVSGGWNFRQSASTPVIDIRNSSHVDITNLQLYFPSGTGVGLSAANSDSLRISHNEFIAGAASAIVFSGVPASTVTGNVMNGITATSIISLINSSADVISSNTINGTATNGILLDANSNGIGGLETNQIGFSGKGVITNLLVNNGVSPIGAASGIQVGLNGSVARIRQAVRLTGSPLCTAASNATCSFTLTFPKAFPDTNWMGSCTVEASTGAGAVVSIFAGGKTTTTAAVTFKDFSAATNALTVVTCEGWD